MIIKLFEIWTYSAFTRYISPTTLLPWLLHFIFPRVLCSWLGISLLCMFTYITPIYLSRLSLITPTPRITKLLLHNVLVLFWIYPNFSILMYYWFINLYFLIWCEFHVNKSCLTHLFSLVHNMCKWMFRNRLIKESTNKYISTVLILNPLLNIRIMFSFTSPKKPLTALDLVVVA